MAERHYSKSEVIEEIFRFSKNRWIALYSSEGYFRRYQENGVPLKAERLLDIEKMIRDYSVRSIYASICTFKSLKTRYDTDEESNIIDCMPTIDVDNKLEAWRQTIEVIKEALSILEEYNVKKSIIIKWSGEGCHLHLNPKAIDSELIEKYGALNLAYSITEFLIRKLEPRIFSLRLENPELKIENKIDKKRVFTCPLSLHRSINKVCVCIDPLELDDFEIEWAGLENYRHFKGWDVFLKGEMNELAITAYREIGPKPFRRKRKYPKLDEQIRKFLEQKT